MRLRIKRVAGAAAGAAALGLGVTAAVAITGGTPDTGPVAVHPNVAMTIYYTADGRFRCSATLVSPTVLITAAHCTDGIRGKTLVTFDSDLEDNRPFPRAADDPGDGTSSTGYTGGSGVFVTGTSYTHPAYSNFTDLRNWNDVGVVVLDRPVAGIAPARLSPRNYLDGFAQPTLNKTLFRVVGFGTEVRKPEAGPQKPVPFGTPLWRRYADMPGQKLTPQILQTNGNINDPRGTGGTCFGDSGGPAFLNGQLVTVTSYGRTENCRYIDGLQRVDIPVVRDWVDGFLS